MDELEEKPETIRVFMKRSICQARKDGDKWKIKGPCWSNELEMDQETFDDNFVTI